MLCTILSYVQKYFSTDLKTSFRPGLPSPQCLMSVPLTPLSPSKHRGLCGCPVQAGGCVQLVLRMVQAASQLTNSPGGVP